MLGVHFFCRTLYYHHHHYYYTLTDHEATVRECIHSKLHHYRNNN